uniref:hypothetical protein n=1 Tax=Streptococcus alactolyticus TaxID=29389 RepID=UPI003D80E28A
MYQDKKKPLLRRGFSGLFSPLFHFVQNSPFFPEDIKKDPFRSIHLFPVLYSPKLKAIRHPT